MSFRNDFVRNICWGLYKHPPLSRHDPAIFCRVRKYHMRDHVRPDDIPVPVSSLKWLYEHRTKEIQATYNATGFNTDELKQLSDALVYLARVIRWIEYRIAKGDGNAQRT